MNGGDLKVALVLLVKNEFDEIPYWIAWHLSIGCDTLFIFDDGSSDGTATIAAAAAKKFDVRIYKLEGSSEFFVVRQQRAYEFILRENAAEFDWIGFLDADEYLHVNEGGDVKAFLSNYTNADAVAINWCNFGSNNHIAKPTNPPMIAYTWHSARKDFYNQHVKSFIRPKATASRFIDVHRFAVEDSRYVRPSGEIVRWHNEGGVTKDHAEWTVARILHFRSRSMEHFVERIRKREDLSSCTPHDFVEFDKNQSRDSLVFHNMKEFYKILQEITHSYADLLADDIKSRFFQSKMEAGENKLDSIGNTLKLHGNASSNAFYKAQGWISDLSDKPVDHSYTVRAANSSQKDDFRFYYIQTHWNSLLAIDGVGGKICHYKPAAELNENRYPRVLVALSQLKPSFGILFALGNTYPIPATDDTRVACFLNYVIQYFDSKPGRVALLHPRYFKYMSAGPVSESDGIGEIRVNRWRTKNWETFQLLEVDHMLDRQVRNDKQIGPLLNSLPDYSASTVDLPTLRSWASDVPEDIRRHALPIAINMMSSGERDRLERVSGLPVSNLI